MEGLQERYEQVLKESQESPEIMGLFLGGSRGKSEAFLTQYSDMDVYVVLSDNASQELESKLKAFESDGFEIRVYRLTYFKEYASWRGEKESDRYDFAHNKAVLDKTGEIQKIIDEKGQLPADVQTEVIKKNLGNYYNQFYRSSKYTRDGKEFAAYLDAVESLPFLETALYALEGRVRPYNKYFEWELKSYPLVFLPWTPEEFISDYKHILQTGDFITQLKIYSGVKKLFEEKGFNSKITGWIGDVLGSK